MDEHEAIPSICIGMRAFINAHEIVPSKTDIKASLLSICFKTKPFIIK